MSRASMRMKQYRPMSADFSKVGTLSSVFGLNPEQNKGNSSNGVLLINYKRSTPDCSPTSSPRPNLRRASVGVVPLSGGVPLTSGGVAPIATQEHLEEELEEDNCEGNDNDNSNIGSNCNSNVKSSTPKRSKNAKGVLTSTKNSRQMRSSTSSPRDDTKKGRHDSDPKSDNSVFWSDEESTVALDETDDISAATRSNRTGPDSATAGSGGTMSSSGDGCDDDSDSDLVIEAREDDFESFSCTDEDDEETGPTSLDSSNRSQDDNGETKSRFIKTKSLREKFKESRPWNTLRKSAEKEIPPAAALQAISTPATTVSANVGPEQTAPEGRLSRLFSLRRSVGPTTGPFDTSKTSMPRLAEEEEQMLGGPGHAPPTRRQQPPTLPPMPSGLTPEQLKRRHIVASLVHSENNYVASLQRLVNDYKKPLEESSPPILSHNKVQLLFHRVPEILNCHTLFRIALSEAIRNWDKEEKIGDVFVASFSKAVVLEIYSDFINNFTAAMECAKQESKRKSALADFLKVKQITAHDRVSFFGLMVKPVQRFPQFILLLQDLLKETPPGHPDRMALQLALTTLESLAEMLNERKREAEQFAAFRDKMRNISGKFPPPKSSQFPGTYTYNSSSSHDGSTSNTTSSAGASSQQSGNRFLLREDDMTQLEFNAAGLVSRSKQRRLLLLNDLLVCATVNGRTSEVEFGGSSGGNLTGYANERLSLKWAVPVNEVELIDGAAGGTLARVLGAGTSSGFGTGTTTKRASLTRSVTPNHLGLSSLTLSSVGVGYTGSMSGAASSIAGGQDNGQAENLAQDMSDLMHDFDVVSRIASLIGTLKGKYETQGLTTALTTSIMSDIQRSIRQKDEEMSWLDACCLHFAIKGKTKTETYTFQTRDPNVKKEWIVELRLAQLALDTNNSPGWDVLEQERSVSTKMPLYVKSHLVLQSPRRQTEVTCASSYTLLVQTPTRTHRPQTFVWANATDGFNSFLRIFSMTSHHTGLKEMGTITLEDTSVKAVQYVPGLHGGIASPDGEQLKGDLVWVGTDSKRIIIYSALDPDRGTQLGYATLPGDILCIQYHCDAVWVGLANGTLAVFRRNLLSLIWDLGNIQLISLGTDPVVCLLPVRSSGLYAACGKRVWVVDAHTNEQLKSFIVQPRNCSSNGVSGTAVAAEADQQLYVHQMAQSGVGLWVALRNSSTICLYHTETFRHLQDINIASNVSRVLAARYVSQPQRNIYVTALLASRGLLWVGTNVGIALTVPLPRLEGVPIISGRANISYHAHYGCVSFFLNINHKVELPSNLLPSVCHINNNIINNNNNGPASLPVTMEDSHMIREESEHESSEEDDPLEVSQEDKTTLKKKFSDSVLPSLAIEKSNTIPANSTGPPQNGSTKLRYRNSSPIITKRPRTAAPQVHASRRTSKTLPRGFSLTNGEVPGVNEYDVYGLYGELLNVRDYDCDSGELVRQGDDMRKSDPELSTIPYRVSTLDRRVRMKTSRPRSLDMSSWSVESRGSSGQTTSSSEAGSERPSPNVSRNASFQSTSAATISVTSTTNSNSGPPSITSMASSTVSSSASTHSNSNNTNITTSQTSASKTPSRPKMDNPKTVTTLMGGRGYINWRRAQVEKNRTAALAQINNCDAFLVIWEMKL